MRKINSEYDDSSLAQFTIDQVTKYYPGRLDDLRYGRLEVDIRVVLSQVDANIYADLKKASSIDDPACVLIMGYNRAVLYLQPYLVDLNR